MTELQIKPGDKIAIAGARYIQDGKELTGTVEHAEKTVYDGWKIKFKDSVPGIITSWNQYHDEGEIVEINGVRV